MEAALQPTQHPIGRAYSEARIAVDDGYIWPFERNRMVAAGPIRERMVEDIGRLVNDGGDDAVVSLEDLGRKGWSLAQIADHGRLAFATFNAEHGPKHVRRKRAGSHTARRIAADAAAAIIFVAFVGLAAGLHSGVL